MKTIVGNSPYPSEVSKAIVGDTPKLSGDIKAIIGNTPKPSGDIKTIAGNIFKLSEVLPTIIFVTSEGPDGLKTIVGSKITKYLHKKMILMATQIKSFGMGKMTIGSCSDFHSNVLGFITTATAAALHVENKVSNYTAAVETLASIVNRQRAFVATVDLKDTDKTRDSASGVISNVTNAFLTSPVAETCAAAHLLSPQLSPYKGIRNHEYTKQTAEVKGMLAMLDLPENKAAIAVLGLTAEVKALREANVAFEEAFLNKTTEMSSRMTESDVKSADAVAAANTLYGEIVQTVNAYAIVQPSDVITTFIANINGLVGTYSHIAGSSNSGSTTPGDDDKPIIPDDDDDRPVIE